MRPLRQRGGSVRMSAQEPLLSANNIRSWHYRQDRRGYLRGERKCKHSLFSHTKGLLLQYFFILLLVLRHLRISAISPGQNSARQIAHLLEARLAQEVYRLCAACAGAAMSYDLTAGVELVHSLG
jgi:hypothetical protein